MKPEFFGVVLVRRVKTFSWPQERMVKIARIGEKVLVRTSGGFFADFRKNFERYTKKVRLYVWNEMHNT